jgi:hypothetical protein
MDFAGALAAFPADADRLEGLSLESEADQYARDILRAAVRREGDRVRELLLTAWGTRSLILSVNDALRDRIPDALLSPKPPVRIDAAAAPRPAGVSAGSSNALDAAFRPILEAETTPPVEAVLALGRALAEARLYELLRECPNPGGGLLDAATRLHLPLSPEDRKRVNDAAYVHGQLRRFAEARPGEAESWLHARDKLRKFKKRVDRELEERAWPPEARTPPGAAAVPPAPAVGPPTIPTPALAPASGESAPEIDLEAKALALLFQHPDWSILQIAQLLGVDRRTPYKWDKFRNAAEAAGRLKPRGRKDRTPRRGHKDRDGRVEAYADEDEDE